MRGFKQALITISMESLINYNIVIPANAGIQ